MHMWSNRVRSLFGLVAATCMLTLSMVAVGQLPASADSYGSAVLSDSPSSFWRFNEANGTTATDSSGNGTSGTYAGSPIFKVVGADPNSTDRAVSFINNSSMNSGTSLVAPNTFTMEIWFKTQTTSGGMIAGFNDGGTNNDRNLAMDNAGHVIFGVNPGSSTVVTSPSTYNNGAWHLAAATLSSQGMKLYIDGAVVASNAGPTSGQSMTGHWTAGYYAGFYAPAWSANSSSLQMSGVVDDFAVWNSVALTSTRLAAHYSAVSLVLVPVNPQFGPAQSVLSENPSAFWRFNESSGTSAADSSGNSVTGTYSGLSQYNLEGSDPNSTDRSILLDVNAGVMNSNTSLAGPNTMTNQIWFRTQTTKGGLISGFTDGGGNDDRNIAMDNAGHVIFGISWSSHTTITSSRTYNDGYWHLATATLSSQGMRLYMDGTLAASNASATYGQSFTGHWMAGYFGSFSRSVWAANSTDYQINGAVDDFAVWNTVALTPAQVAANYFNTGANVVASATIDPTMTFTVSGHSGACGSVAQTGSANGSSVSLGHVSASGTTTAAQDVAITSNAGGGVSLNTRFSGPLTDNASHTIPNMPGDGTWVNAQAFPASGTAAFGYRFGWMTDGQWMPFLTTNIVDKSSSGPVVTDCVAFQAQTSSVTPAGAYSTTVYYTAVPTF